MGDHLDSVTDNTAMDGTRAGLTAYDPFGRASTTGATVTAGFTGHMSTAVQGLAVAMYRAYDPALGRWLRQDPIGMADNVNQFSYVGNRPLSYVDPAGLAAQCSSSRTIGPWMWSGRTRRGLSDWVLSNTWSLGTMHSMFVPVGVLGCLWTRNVEVTDHYKRVSLDLKTCIDPGDECRQGRTWMEFGISSFEEMTRSFAYVEKRILTYTIPSGFLPTRLLRVLLCIQYGPPRM